MREVEFASPVTAELAGVAMDREALRKARMALGNRLMGEEWDTDVLASEAATYVNVNGDAYTPWALVDAAYRAQERELRNMLRKHEVWPWLKEQKGLGGVYTALLIAGIAHPGRFPGQLCTGFKTDDGARAYHHLVSRFDPDERCPMHLQTGDDEKVKRCRGKMLAPRPGTGVRSLWHYLGLHALEDGTSPRFKKGVQADWSPALRSAVLFQLGEQIVRQRGKFDTEYGRRYDAEKARLHDRGPLSPAQAKPDAPDEVRDGWADHTARKIAAKAFVGDLLVNWKAALA